MMNDTAGQMTDSNDTAPVLSIGAVSKKFDSFTVLDNCSLDVAEGEIVTLLGQSGCGKTTLLRCIAGFWEADNGNIRIDGQDMGSIPVNRRPVGVVFQSYALFPHMTVTQNVGYALRMLGMSRSAIAERVTKTLETVSLTGFEERFPSQLSGGQQQRVAIARVLVMEPRVLLLDEPFNALDAKLRGSMQVELRQLIKKLNLTSVFVTHDQEEALTMSDRIAIMRAGCIEQAAPPEEIFDHPATAYVADFIGMSNFFIGEALDGSVALPDGQCQSTELKGSVKVMVRPHNIRLVEPDANRWRGTISFHRPVGPLIEYHVDVADELIKVLSMRQEQSQIYADGAQVGLRVINPAFCSVYPGEH